MSRDWASIPKQTFLVEDGKIGDCWRCCIAAVLGLPAEDVPHFLQGDDGEYNPCCDADTQRWLNGRGYVLTYAYSQGRTQRALGFPCYSKECPSVALIAAGPTPRSRGLGKHHAVVMLDGQIVYDPHPSEAGLTAIAEEYLIFKPV